MHATHTLIMWRLPLPGWPKLPAALALILGLAISPVRADPKAGPDSLVSQSQALALAQAAFKAGDKAVANQIARRILEQDPNDPLALLMVAATGPDLGQARIARLSGGAAWRNAQGLPDGLRYEIARHTARAAMIEGRSVFAEVWLRRALDVAPDPELKQKVQTDLAGLRAGRPVDLRLSGSLTPSSNLNSGAAGSQFLIDGRYPVGPISATGQQLAGLRANVTAEMVFRSLVRDKSRTEFGLALHAARHWLSPEAQGKIDSDPMLAGQGRFTGADLNSTVLEARLRHQMALAGLKAPVRLGLTASNTWTAAVPGQHALAVGLTWPVATGPLARLELGLNARRQWNVSGAPTDLIGARLAGEARLGPGALQYSVSASLQNRPGDVNSSFRQASAELGYQLDQTGPVRIGTSLYLSSRDQDDYRLGPIAVTGGRHDRNIGLSLSMGFREITLLGLEPTLAINGQRGFSNLSRFEGSEIALGLGLAARF